MHKTAMENGRLFFHTYVKPTPETVIVDVGAQDVNGSLRSVAPTECRYIGVDFAEGNGVDIVITDPYSLPFEDESADVCVTSSCFEHSEFFWLSFLEIMRILKPAGLLYINVPSNGAFHRYPVDCWRFYPDSGVALQNWARRNGYDAELLESYVSYHDTGIWNDFVGVFVRDRRHAGRYPTRMQARLTRYTNGRSLGEDGFTNFCEELEPPSLPARIVRKARRMVFGGPE